MAAFVPGYDHDLFISYAHVDNQQRIPGDPDSAWVTTFADQLKIVVAQKFGRADWADSWRDPRLRGHEPVTPEIEQAVRNSATLVVILSEGYLQSEWCLRELELFLKARRGSEGASGRLFVVARDDINRERWPEVFRDLLGYEFFLKEGGRARTLGVPTLDSKDQLYFTRIDDLSAELVDCLRKLKTLEERESSPLGVTSPESTGHAGCIFLSEVSPDLEYQREDVKRYLTHLNIRVLPERYYNRSPSMYQESMKEDLLVADLFVQLLGPFPGVNTEDLPNGYLGLQLEQATAAEKPMLRWRDSNVDLNTILDPDHRKALNATDVIATDLETLKREIEEKLRMSLVPSPIPDMVGDHFVLINADNLDIHVADEIIEELEKNEMGYHVISNEDPPIDKMSDEDDYDALMVVYGSSPKSWVEDQVRLCRRVMLKKKPSPPLCAVYLGPPKEKERLRCKPPRFFFFDYSQDASFEQFIEKVKTRRAEV